MADSLGTVFEGYGVWDHRLQQLQRCPLSLCAASAECKLVLLTNVEKESQAGSGPMSMASFEVYNYFNKVLFKLSPFMY